jgi:hypothetical protein
MINRPGPLWTAIRAQLRASLDARRARMALERELASYTSLPELNDLDAIVARHTDQDTTDIRRVLSDRRITLHRQAASSAR